MPQKNEKNIPVTIDKKAEAAALANRESLFKAESKNMAEKPQSLKPTIEAMAKALGFEQGKVPEDVVRKFDALREEMQKFAPPPVKE